MQSTLTYMITNKSVLEETRRERAGEEMFSGDGCCGEERIGQNRVGEREKRGKKTNIRRKIRRGGGWGCTQKRGGKGKKGGK